jgi:hypothetical protein
MTQALYAQMSNKTIKTNKQKKKYGSLELGIYCHRIEYRRATTVH